MTDQADALAGTNAYLTEEIQRMRRRLMDLTSENERLKREVAEGFTVQVADVTNDAATLAECGWLKAENERLKETERALTEKVMRYDHEVGVARQENERLKKLDAEFAVAMTEAMAENERLKGTLADWVTAYERWTVNNSADAFHPELRPHLEQLEMENERLKGECQEREESFNILVRTAAGIQADREKERVRAEQAEGERDEQAAKHADCCVDRQDLADAIHAKTGWRIRAVQAEATLARVREGLTREKIINAIDEAWDTPRDSDPREDAADAILALLAPEGNQ